MSIYEDENILHNSSESDISEDINEIRKCSGEMIEESSDNNKVNFFGALMNLLNGILGSGLLTIASTMKSCGIIFSIILMLFICFLSYTATIILLKTQERTGANGLDELTKKTCGKISAYIMTCLILTFCVTAQISYLIIGSDMIKTFLSLGGYKMNNGFQRIVLVTIYSLSVPVMLTIPRKVSFLSYFSFATVICVIFFFIVMIIKAIMEFPVKGVSKDIKYFSFSIDIFRSISLYSMSFALPIIILPLVLPYKKSLSKRLGTTLLAISICFVLCVVTGLLGYLMFGENSKGDILLSFGEKDYLIICVKIGFLFVVTFSYPCVSMSVMPTYSYLFFKESKQYEMPIKKRMIVLLVSNSIPVIAAIFLPSILPALSIGGGPGCIVDFFFPPFMALMTSKHKWYTPKNILYIIFALLGLFLGVISTYCGIVETIRSFR